MPYDKDGRPFDLIDWLGFRQPPDFLRARPLGAFFGVLIVLFMVGAIVTAGLVMIHTARQAMAPAGEGPNLGAGALVAAILGAPFVIWATWLRQRAVNLSDAAHFNDKINVAVEALYSRREVTRLVLQDGKETVLTEWQDDVLKRSAAIDRLEGLARERPTEAPRIAAMLSIYVRELSRELPPRDHPRRKWLKLVEPDDDSPPMDDTQALHHLGLDPDAVTIDSLQTWARNLSPCRADLEKAAQTLGRLLDVPGAARDAIRIDLRRANLQGFDLRGLRLEQANLLEAHLEGADLRGAHLEGAILWGAYLEGATLFDAHLEGAILGGAHLEGANLREAHAEGATLREAHLKGASLWRAHLEGAILRDAHLEGASLSGAHLEGANLWHAHLEQADLSGADLEEADLMGAHLDGANLRDARLKSAVLIDWTCARASLRSADFTGVTTLTQEGVNAAWGDRGTVLPPGIARPDHWPDEGLLPWVEKDPAYDAWIAAGAPLGKPRA